MTYFWCSFEFFGNSVYDIPYASVEIFTLIVLYGMNVSEKMGCQLLFQSFLVLLNIPSMLLEEPVYHVLLSKGPATRWDFAPWNKGQCPHGALLHAVSGCCKCFQQCRIARAGSTAPVALKMSSREGLGAMLHEAKLHRLDCPKQIHVCHLLLFRNINI